MKHSELYNLRVHHTESIVTFPTGNVKDKCVFDLDFSGEVPRQGLVRAGRGASPVLRMGLFFYPSWGL